MSRLSMMNKSEISCFVKVLAEERPDITPEEVLSELTLINRLLMMQKNYVLMSRKRGLRTELDQVIGHHLGIKKEINLNTKGR